MIFLSFKSTKLCYQTITSCGSSNIYSHIFRSGDCLQIDTCQDPFFYTFTSSEQISLTTYHSDLNHTELIFDQSSSGSSINSAGVIDSGPATLFFEFPDGGDFSIGYASFGNINCSRVFISDSRNNWYSFSNKVEGFFSLPIQDTRCFFYSASGTQNLTAELGYCNNCPTIQIRAGLKHLLASIDKKATTKVVNPMTNTPTFVIITPPEFSPSDAESMSFGITSTEGSPGNGTYVELLGRQYKSPTKIIIMKHPGNYIALSFTITIGVCFMTLLSYIICKEKLWCRNSSKDEVFNSCGQTSQVPMISAFAAKSESSMFSGYV